MAFTHLHVHTEYSLLDGSNKVTECVKRVKELGMDSCAITDHGVMYGVINFYRAAKEAGIKPILGCEVYVAPGSRFDKEAGAGDDRYYHLVLLAENNTGYANLMKIVSKGHTEGFYYRPRVDMEVLKEYHEGIIALSACLAGEVQRFILRGMIDEAKKAALRHLEIFGKDNYFLELQDHGMAEQQTVNAALLSMSKELGIPLVATNDIHYTYEDDVKPHDILLCLQTGKKLADEDRMRYEGGQYYIKSEEEMKTLFPYALDAIENTHIIAERCNVEIEFGVTKLPKFDVPEGYDSWTYLNKLCYDGLAERYEKDEDGELAKRLQYELDTIKKMGYVDYFLIVWDFINYAKTHGVMVGPGRGSAAGSMVSYCLKISQVDPIKYNLLFERFLNPERVTMPDIDVDFCPEHRQDVIDYVSDKYGADKVVQIITFGRMQAKGVIRDVARVMDLPYSFADQLAKMIPKELNITLEKSMEMNPELKALYESDEQVHELIEMCLKLEGLPRNASTHASGVVICQKPADDFVPLSRGTEGAIVTQFEKDTVEQLGLLKMDFLGLRNLTIIENACNLIKMSQGIDIDIDQLVCTEPEVFESLWTGKTDGVFQLESAGMKNFMKELKAKSFEDVVAGISLYRPGPMDFIPQYIEGKENEGNVTYACPELKPILEPTYGCIVYQEQVMQIVRDLGGYTLGRSDLVRRAMSKKKQSVMEEERKNFVYGNEAEGVPGCIARGIDEHVADEIFGKMMDFAKYAFNKSHAACYAVVAYQTAWLKYHYPVEYMAALLTSVIDEAKKVSAYIMTCRNMGIQILPPDVNEGLSGFSVKDGAIIYALTAIKGVGKNIVDKIVKERTDRGPFTTINDFISRMSETEVNKRLVENFIKAGAFDSLPGNRAQKMSVFVPIMDNIQKNQKNNFAGQMSLFDIVGEEQKEAFDIRMPNIPEYKKEILLGFEKEVTGFYVSGHPLDEYEKFWKRQITTTTAEFMYNEEPSGDEEGSEDDQNQISDNLKVTIGGMITAKTVKYTKNNKIMAFLTLEDLAGSVEVIVFPNQYEKFSSKLVEEAKVFITGRTNVEENKDGKLILESVMTFEEAPKKLWVVFESIAEYEQKDAVLKSILETSEGNDVVQIFCKAERQMKVLPRNCNIKADEEILSHLRMAFGENNVYLT